MAFFSPALKKKKKHKTTLLLSHPNRVLLVTSSKKYHKQPNKLLLGPVFLLETRADMKYSFFFSIHRNQMYSSENLITDTAKKK